MTTWKQRHVKGITRSDEPTEFRLSVKLSTLTALIVLFSTAAGSCFQQKPAVYFSFDPRPKISCNVLNKGY